MATLYWAIYPSANGDPTDTQIITETVPSGIHGSDTAPTTTGAFAGTAISGLAASTSYKLAAVWDDGTDTSNVVVGSAFVTAAPTAVEAPSPLQQLSNQFSTIAASRLNGVLQ